MKVTSPQPTSETLLGSLASAEPSIARGESGVKKNRSTKSDKTAAQKAVDALYEADKTRGEDAANLAALRKDVLDKTYMSILRQRNAIPYFETFLLSLNLMFFAFWLLVDCNAAKAARGGKCFCSDCKKMRCMV